MVEISRVYGIIYCATNVINDKKYIGQTIRGLATRKREHIALSETDCEFAFSQAIRKYGKNKFKWTIIDHAHSQAELDEKERYWIKHYNTFYEGGYNMALGGQNNMSDDPEEMSIMRGGRAFYVFDLEGNFIEERISQAEFAREIDITIQSINNVLREIKGKYRIKDYILIFKDEFSEEVLARKVAKIKDIYKPFVVFDEELNYIGIWNNRTRCAKEIGFSQGAILAQLNGNKKYPNRRRFKVFFLENVPKELQHKIKEVI